MSTLDQPATIAQPKTLGIVSIVLAGISVFTGHLFVFALAAIVVGIIGRTKEPAGRKLSTWGIVVGSVMLVLPALVIVAGLSLLVPFGIAAALFAH
jgi:hypothetical protein